MSAIPKTLLTAEEYLAFERKSEFRHEYYRGEIFQMSGASREHNLIVFNLARQISSQLRGKNCEGYANDMRVFTPITGLYTYPDLTVVCGEPEFADAEFDTLLNPVILIEVLSPSTADYDRGKKFWNYQSIETLREYLLIAQDEIKIEHLIKLANGRWDVREYSLPDAKIELSSIGIGLEISEIYEKIFKI
ncbi:MAG: Uma2 family endonuclease [Pyrinomonadaceae bacterium]